MAGGQTRAGYSCDAGVQRRSQSPARGAESDDLPAASRTPGM